jgi:type I restriction enzyme S subunit
LKLNQGNLKTIPVPLAPPEQQKRIVAKIEELFSHIDAGIAALNKAKKLLKQYRQSVLKAAVTGELTKQWREDNKREKSIDWLKSINLIRQDLIEKKEITKPKKTAAILDDEVPYQIPDTWEWARLDDLVITSVDCPHSTAKYKGQGKKCVRTSDFLPGKLVLSKVRYVTAEEFIERNKRLTPQPNDVLYSREGGILGIACMIPEQEEVCLGQRMMIFRTESKLSSIYLMHNLNSPLIVNRVKGLISGSASPHLNVGEIRNFLLPIPPKDECEILLSLVDEKLSSIERLEHEVDLQLVKSNKNKQSILASSFSGDLM